MICKVIETISNYNMLPRGGEVCVAVSGGADSMSLLHILNDVKEQFAVSVTAAHVNHGIRGDAADMDESFVRAECEKLGIPLKVLRVDVPALAKKSGEGLEQCGRRVRYDFFSSMGENVIIATAHNADDRAETFLFNFARGATIRGLCSVPPVRGNIIRPLLDCTKAEILEYCRLNSIKYVTDETNGDITYARNRIRHMVIPQLREVNHGFDKCASRCIFSLCEDDDLLEALCSKLIDDAAVSGGYSCEVLLAAHPALCKRAISRIIEREQNKTVDYDTVARVRELLGGNGKIQIFGGGFIRVRKGVLDFPSYVSSDVGCTRLFFGENLIGKYIAEMEIENANEKNIFHLNDNYLLECCADYDKICGNVYLRSRAEGDRITLRARGCSKSLKKLFNESGIAPEKRDEILVVSDDSGVVFVQGFGCDGRCSVTGDTKRVLRIIIRRN